MFSSYHGDFRRRHSRSARRFASPPRNARLDRRNARSARCMASLDDDREQLATSRASARRLSSSTKRHREISRARVAISSRGDRSVTCRPRAPIVGPTWDCILERALCRARGGAVDLWTGASARAVTRCARPQGPQRQTLERARLPEKFFVFGDPSRERCAERARPRWGGSWRERGPCPGGGAQLRACARKRSRRSHVGRVRAATAGRSRPRAPSSSRRGRRRAASRARLRGGAPRPGRSSG